MDLGGAVSGFSSAISTLFDLSRANRLRRSIGANLELYGVIQSHTELAKSRDELGSLIERQVLHLAAGGDGTVRRSYGWGGFLVGLGFTTAVAYPLRWTWQLSDKWWGWPIILIHGFVVVIFVYASFGALMSPSDSPSRKERKAAALEARAAETN